MRTVQACRRMGFPAEPPLKVLVLRQIRGQHLNGDDAVRLAVVGTPHLAHAAAAQQFIPPEVVPVLGYSARSRSRGLR
jgi:hypothetical protein